jgi:hypothetical protein
MHVFTRSLANLEGVIGQMTRVKLIDRFVKSATTNGRKSPIFMDDEVSLMTACSALHFHLTNTSYGLPGGPLDALNAQDRTDRQCCYTSRSHNDVHMRKLTLLRALHAPLLFYRNNIRSAFCADVDGEDAH